LPEPHEVTITMRAQHMLRLQQLLQLLAAHTSVGAVSAAPPAPPAPPAAGDYVYAITTFSIAHGFNIYTMPAAAATANTAIPTLRSIGKLSYPLPGGLTTQIATTAPGSNATTYMPWVGGNLRDHTLFAHNGELYAVCTTGWGKGASGPGNFHIIKRKPQPSGQWVFHR
jgi:hypothetical protein